MIAHYSPIRRAIAVCTVALLFVSTGCDTNSPEDDPVTLTEINCDNFTQFTGEKKTFVVVGTSVQFTTVTNPFNEQINGHDVIQIRIPGEHPEGLGEYVGCDPDKGYLDVATDSWDAFNPTNTAHHRRNIWEPALYFCKYGTPANTECIWEGLDDGEPERQVTRVLAYETAAVPYGSRESVMKMEILNYDEGGLYTHGLFWMDEALGIIRAADPETGDVVELIAYVPPTASKMSRPSPALLDVSLMRQLQRHLATASVSVAPSR